MSEDPEIGSPKERTAFSREVGAKAARKLRARKSNQGVWFGLGMMGLIGWSVVVPTLLGAAFGIWLDNRYPGRVVVPTLLGAAFGIWLDNRYPGRHSWTLMLLIAGLECLPG